MTCGSCAWTLMTPWCCHCHCPPALWGLIVSAAQLNCPKLVQVNICGSVCVFVIETNRSTPKEIPRDRALRFLVFMAKWHVLNTSGCEWNRNATHASRNLKQQQRLIWEKPVFVTYKVTCPCENAIYVKHAPNGKKRTREQATRESWTQKNAALVFINEEHSSLWWNKRTGMRRPGDDEREKRERNTRRSFTLPE